MTAVPEPSLVGRAAERARASSLLRRVAQGFGGVLVIEGAAGIGKTRLAAEALAVARGSGSTTILCQGEELERRRPFGILADGLGLDPRSADGQCAAVGRLLAGDPLEGTGESMFMMSAEAEFRGTEAILVLIEDLCAQGPVVLVAEDLHWSDPASLAVLHRLGRRVDDLPLLLVATCRPVPRPAELDQLIESLMGRGAIHLTLGPLDPPAVMDLVRVLIGAEPGTNLLTQTKGAGGNPLFVMELVRALERDGSLVPTAAGEVDTAVSTVPASLRLTLLHSLRGIPDEAVEVLRVGSVLGGSFSVDDLSVALATPAADLLAPLRECMRAGLLIESGDRLAFRHDLIREALYEDLPEVLRKALHLQAARALAAAGRAPEKVAEQFGRGASPGDREAVEWLQRSARAAAPRSPGVALEILERALELDDAADPRRDELLVEQATSLLWAGRLPEAEAACRQLLDRAHDPAVEATVRGCLVNAVVLGGRSAEAVREIEAAVGSAGLAPVERVRLLAWGALGLMILGELARSAEMARAAVDEAEHLGEELALGLGLGVLGLVTSYRGDFFLGCRLADRSIELADRSEGRLAHRFPVRYFRSFLLMTVDRFEEGRSDIRTGMRMADELGTKWALPLYHWLSMYERFHAGEWDDAIVDYEAGTSLVEDTGMREGTIAGAALRAHIAIHRGDLECAGRAWTWLVLVDALLAEASGDVERAADSLADAWDRVTAAGLAVTYPVLGSDLVRLALARGDRRRAEAVTAILEGLDRRNEGVPSLAGAARLARGQVDDDLDMLLAAVAAYGPGPRVVERAQASELVGRALGKRQRLEEARPLLDRALATFEALGAVRDVTRIEAVLRDLGVRRGRRGPRGRPKFGWESLTEKESQVVGLVASGLSNPQIAERLFLSRHTVHTHVSHVLGKLGLSSRVELAREAARRPP